MEREFLKTTIKKKVTRCPTEEISLFTQKATENWRRNKDKGIRVD